MRHLREVRFARPALELADTFPFRVPVIAGLLGGELRFPTAVTIAATAHEALAALQAATPDLIITELNLPDAEGIEFIAQIHRTPAPMMC